ncbi:hypothetical protein DRP04_03585 [Archaeoglobales archaeon]|nr:MAG: hypothetical protein DRP04_03585 [Archaeoglobales archaeon]
MPIKRKIVKVGRTSYSITLPKDWVELNDLKEGDFVLLEVNEVIIVKPPKR